MRRFGVVALGLPVIGLVYARAALRRSVALRIALAVVVGGVLGGAAIAFVGTDPTVAGPPLSIAPVAPAAFTTTLRTSVGLHDPITIRFDRPMDPASVAAAVAVDPTAAVRLDLADDDRSLLVSPTHRWDAATFYSISVGASARSRDGATLDRPVRAAFVTRPAGSAILSEGPSPTSGGGPLQPAVLVSSDVPIGVATLRAALRISPAIAVVVDGPGPDAEPATAFEIRPAAALAPGATYRFSIDPRLVDVDGARIDVGPAFALRLPDAPTVIRFRPAAHARHVARDTTLSVRFSERMDPSTTTGAFRATVKGSRVAFRSTRWAENGTVLVAVPTSPLPAGATVTIAVGPDATSATGVRLGSSVSGSFTVVAAAKPTPTTAHRSAPKPAPTPVASGTSAGSATWYAVEKYYLGLMNCTRTGGWVTSSGSCSSPGGRNVAPLALSAGISSKVSRPYAKYLAMHAECSHFIGGTPGDRLRRAGYTSYRWAENLGCRSGDPYAAVLGSHLYFQSEKSYGGGHYVNLMNALYDRVGIGVWVSSGRVRLVVDFYHP